MQSNNLFAKLLTSMSSFESSARVIPPTYHRGWQEWVAENLMRGCEPSELIQLMVGAGFSEEFAAGVIQELVGSPSIAAGQRIYKDRQKLASLFDALGELFKESEFPNVLPKQSNISPEKFYSDYFYANRPVVLTGLMEDWEALKLWTPDYFREQFGAVEVEINADRNTDPKYEPNFTQHNRKMLMKDYIQLLTEGSETNDYYIAGRNKLLKRQEFQILWDHFQVPDKILNSSTIRDQEPNFWFGPKGTITPLHHDLMNILLGQVYGKKLVKLIHPYYIDHLYREHNYYSAVELESIDYNHFPLMQQVPIIEVVLEPGDFVLIPIGWWHWVKSLEVSISLSFRNFLFKDSLIKWIHDY